MKPEDIDWKLFHMVPEKDSVTITELCENSGFEKEVVVDSLKRLERSCLLSVNGEKVCANSIQDFLMLGEIKNDTDSLIEIENGVIKVRK